MTEQTQLLGINNDQADEHIPLVRQDENAAAPSSPAPPGETVEEEEEVETLEDYADMVITILQPVALTMLLVVWIVKALNAGNVILSSDGTVYQVYSEDEDDSTATKFFGSILNALLFLLIIIVVTVLFVILYKYRCLKMIYAWLITSTGLLLAVFGGFLFMEILIAENLALDIITFSVLLWNFAVVGILSIFWYSPQKVTQGYLIVISGLMAVWFTRLPEWTTWSILAVVAIYDLFAVLCPRGPLKVLVETAQERKEPIPALLYNASVVMMMMNEEEDLETQTSSLRQVLRDNDIHEDEDNADHRSQRAILTTTSTTSNQHDDTSNNAIADERGDTTSENPPPTGSGEKKGVKLGLGDFVFYSVLIGRAALFDMITVFTCFIGIITGLFMTLLLLAIFRKALPALPISIALGIIFYFLTSLILWPYAVTLGKDQVFI